MRQPTLVCAIMAAALIAGVAPVQAEILRVSSYAANFESTTTPVAVPITVSAATTLKFSTTDADQLVRITFNAERSTFGAVGSWTSASITIDGTPAAPASGDSFAMCTSSVADTFIYTGAVRQSYAVVHKIGTHQLQVIGSVIGGTALWFGDISVVIDR